MKYFLIYIGLVMFCEAFNYLILEYLRLILRNEVIGNAEIIGHSQYFGYPLYFDHFIFYSIIAVPAFIFIFLKKKETI